MSTPTTTQSRTQRWLATDTRATEHDEGHAWWKVMCLTGVDYFSTLGYQPGIAALAAGLLSPLATVVLVLLTLLGALPVYHRVAGESPHGEGSIAMLEHLLGRWSGKLFVLVLLGFAATDFIITMTLSAADASAHVVENPHLQPYLAGQQLWITLGLLALLGGVFLRGFTEAVGVAVAVVAVYLVLNVVVMGVAVAHVAAHPVLVGDWTGALTRQHGSPVAMMGIALLVFPKLALGMSGFETGVAVMPHVRGDVRDDPVRPAGRIRDTRRLLTTAALLMSVFLVVSSVITTLLIPAREFQPGGEANGRALALLAHEYLGNTFGTVYDASTITILWFAGASALAGLLNLVPRYLPRYGMAPEWAGAVRPLVLVLTAVSFGITWIFDASVDAQGGAYATGVLVLFTSAAVAVTLSARRRGQRRRMVAFAVITAVFAYTTVDNMIERPDGLRIGTGFIAAILLVSVASRVRRVFELRATGVGLDSTATVFVRDCARRTIRLVAHEPVDRGVESYAAKVRQIKEVHDLADEQDIIFVEVTVTDPSDFVSAVDVRGEVLHGRYRVLSVESSSVANALAVLMLHVRDVSGALPHIYFEWTEGNPTVHLLRFLLFGQGEVAPVTREVLRRAEPSRTRPGARTCTSDERENEGVTNQAAALGRGRVLAGWGLALLGPAALTAALTPVDNGALSFEAMLFLVVAVGCALVGGRWPAIVASVLGTGLLNYFFTPPLHTLSIANTQNVATLAVFLVTSVAVATVVDSAARRRHQAGLARAEAETLAMLNRSVLGGAYDVPQLLDLVRETFGARTCELVRDDIALGPHDASAQAGTGLRLVLREHRLDASGRRILAAFATHLGVLREREELARQTAAARELEAGNRTRTALLAAVSHDLRTPLAGIRSAAETLSRHDDRLAPEERRALLDALAGATVRLTRMVDDLLDMSRLQTGAVRPEYSDVPLGEVLQAALVGLDGADRVQAGDLPVAHVDAGLLTRVLANLLANALRHSRRVEVTGTVQGLRVCLQVVDHGPGVPPAEREAIFAPFQRRGDASVGDGVGLGLAVARGLTEAQGGRLAAKETAGGGLTMTLDLAGAGP